MVLTAPSTRLPKSLAVVHLGCGGTQGKEPTCTIAGDFVAEMKIELVANEKQIEEAMRTPFHSSQT